MRSDNNSPQELNQENLKEKINLRPSSHSFDTDLAKKYGIEIAIMLKHINYWVNYNEKLKTNFHEGKHWFYNTLDEITAHFEYWSKDQVYRILKKMVDNGLILKGNFNKTSMDRTLWYTINSKSKMDIAKSRNGYCEIATAIPNTNTNTKESISKDIPKKVASDDALLISKYLFTKLRKVNPKHKEPNFNTWTKEIATMMKMENRTKEEVICVIDWAFSQKDDFWPTAILSPKTLRKLFDNACIKKNYKSQKDNELDEIKKVNIRYLKDKIHQLERTGRKGNLQFNKTEATDNVLGKRVSLTSKNMIDIVKSWDRFRK